jgi:hypothetical protein
VISFALGIPHCPWIPERVESLSRLSAALEWVGRDQCTARRIFSDREPNWSWSAKLWAWGAASTDATHLLQVQDDAKVTENFWLDLKRIVESKPDDVIGLESVLSVKEPWYSSRDGLIGVAYVVPVPALRDFLSWRHNAIRADGVKKLNEDQLIGLWCFCTGRPVMHPSVTIVDHDVELPSTYGNDQHTHRRPMRTTVRGDKMPDSLDGPVRPIGLFYGATPTLARRWVKDYSYRAMQEDKRR